MATTQETDALALLDLPELETLTEPQLCGRACAWCETTLSNDTAIDLGQRTSDAHGTPVSWFPRTCRACMGPHVQQTVDHHAALCEQCVDDVAVCDVARVLRGLNLAHTR